MIRRSYSAIEIADAMRVHKRTIAIRALAQEWAFVERPTRGGTARVYDLEALPDDVRIALAAHVATQAAQGDSDSAPAASELDATEAHLTIARARLAAVIAIAEAVAAGEPIGEILDRLSLEHGASVRTIRRWYDRVRELPRTAWLETLLPDWRPHVEYADCHEQAWSYFRDDYLRASKPAFRAVYRRTVDVARAKGWTPVPSLAALRARLEREVPYETRVLRREGRDALARLYPAQEREREHLRALEAVNADGHRFDVRVQWPDGAIERPVMVAFQDLASSKIVGWRIDRTENADLVRLAFGDLVERWGVPEHCYLDNGRGFASKWITGGARWRFRFKVRAEDPVGVMQAVGVQHVHWTTPYHGQSKPIERAFGDLCESIARHPLCEGAYTGNSTVTKPHNYGTRAVPTADFVALVSTQIAEHNARAEREGKVARGRSFDDVFRELYERGPIQRATDAQRRMLLLAAERVRVRQGTGCVHLLGNRYWSPRLAELQGSDVVLRFDPHHLHDHAVHVYRLDGTYVGAADCQAAVGFDDATAAREHARKRRGYVKAVQTAAKAQREFSAAELAGLHLRERLPEKVPTAKVLKPLFGARRDEPTHENDESATDSRAADLLSELGRAALESGRLRARRSATE